jgi:hypothetical protein
VTSRLGTEKSSTFFNSARTFNLTNIQYRLGVYVNRVRIVMYKPDFQVYAKI